MPQLAPPPRPVSHPNPTALRICHLDLTTSPLAHARSPPTRSSAQARPAQRAKALKAAADAPDRAGLHVFLRGNAWGTKYAWAGEAARQYMWPFATATYGPQDSQPLGTPNWRTSSPTA
ncbi:hypothetical protein U9M48_039976 [Paspalum notatum var. saurae]|uniref:Uncharacterized protein n=1 Tax=Paspalum notatum var. saurae TaxID=547442 RepID=A0AAQ3XCP0_PASNO